MRQALAMRTAAAVFGAMVLAACGASGSGTAGRSPAGGSPAPSASPAATPSASPSGSSSPSPAPADLRLVIADYLRDEVRLARLDAFDTATVKGQFDGIVAGRVIVLDGGTLKSLDHAGRVTKLAQLAGVPSGIGPGTVAVRPDLGQWLYSLTDASWTTRIHLGTSGGDTVVATVPSPDGNAFYQPFAWNASGVYMVREATGLGGAGPFLEYHFPLVRFDLASNRIADVSPACIALQVLDDGTFLCRTPSGDGTIEVRSPSGQSNRIRLTIGGASGTYDESAYIRVAVSPDNTRVIAGRNGSKDPVINYQMAVADLSGSAGSAFGPLDFLPDTWLPDGRVVAEHQCASPDFGGGPCSATLEGTYFFSADGASHTLFFKLAQGSTVVGYV